MLFKKMLRTIGRYKAQFISMIIMIAIGVAMFLGFNMEWVSLDKDTGSFWEQTHFADYRIVSSDGFTAEDAEKIANIDGVDSVSRFLSVNADVEGTKNMLGLTVTENPGVSDFLVMEGEEYDENSGDGIWLFDHYAEKNDVKIGDELTLTYEKLKVTGVVKGLIESGEYTICVRDESQIMPDFSNYGYAYISPKLLETALYSSAHDEAWDEVEDSIPVGMPDGFIDDMLNELVEKEAAEKLKSIYPQINVISKLDKSAFGEKADEALGETLMILTKDESISYAESHGEVEEGQTMGSILPVLFLLIAVLTMVTTMHRLAANEKTQIGTLKALGFKDRRILWHYTTFALAIGVVGSAVGIGLGYVIARLIMDPNGMMGTYIVMPDWSIYLPWWCWVILAAIVGFLTLIGFLSTRQMLKGTAADALRPYTPKKMRRLAIEKIKVMDKLSFGTKWNLRDVLRHKSRSFMTLFGILGCTVLIVAALGMNDTASGFLNTYYDDVANYSSKVFISDDTENEDAVKTAGKFDGDYVASVSVQIDDKPVSLDVYHIENDTFHFLSEDNNEMKLGDSGALVCMRIRDDYNLKIGDKITVSPYGTDDEYTVTIAGFTRSMSESIAISDEYAKTLNSGGVSLVDSDSYKIGYFYTQMDKGEISGSGISTIQSKEDIVVSMDSFMEIMNIMIVVLIAAAVLLGVIVLYNLGIMSFTERYREMATLKVVGFKDKQIGKLLISQNIWLSVLGIAIGIPAGYGILVGLLKMLASEYEMSGYISLLSIFISVVLTLGVSLVVGLIIARKNRKIEMVSALKISE